MLALVLSTTCFALLIIRLTIVLPMFQPRKRRRHAVFTNAVSTMIIWGSGGHTGEMILLLKSLPVDRFHDVYHVVSQTDKTSRVKIEGSQIPIARVGTWYSIVRSREVKQLWLTTVFSAIAALLQSFWLVGKLRPRLIICNGPGTCVPICFSAFFFKIVGWSDTTIVFVESFCRVEKLSLTGRLLYPIADHFIVQWTQMMPLYKRAEYLGDVGEK